MLGGQWTSGKTSKRQDGPARFSKQPASGTSGKLGRVCRPGWRARGDGTPGLASRGGIDGPRLHPPKDRPRSFAPKPHGSLPHALGSRYVAQHGRCVPGRVRVHRVRCVPTGKAHSPGRYPVPQRALGPSRPPKGAGANRRSQSTSAQATDPGPLNPPGQDGRTITARSRRTALPPQHWLIGETEASSSVHRIL